MKNLLPLLLMILTALTVNSCKDKIDSRDTSFEARDYFSAFTRGMIEDNDDIIFRVLQHRTIDSTQLRAGISIKPDIDFQIRYIPVKQTVIIDPEEPLERGENYILEIDIEKWFLDGERKTLFTEVTVFHQHLDVTRKGLLLKNNQRFLEVDVFCSIPEKPEAIRSVFDYPKNKIDVTKINDQQFLVRLQIGDDSSENIQWDGSELSSEEKGSIAVYQFDPEVFEVINTHFDRSSKQFKVYFSQHINEEQDKSGFITLGDEPASFDIQNNVLTVYITSQSTEDLTLRINQGLQSQTGIKLNSSLTYEIEVNIVKPDVQWLSEGTYLPSSGEFKLPIRAKGLNSIHVQVIEIPSENTMHFVSWNQMSNIDLIEIKRFGRLKLTKEFELATNTAQAEQWAEYGLDFTGLFQRESGKVYTIMISYGPSNTILHCADQSLMDFETRRVKASFFDEVFQGYYHDEYYEGYRSYGPGYDYRERNNPCHITYYMDRSALIKNIHCTNIFPVIKSGGDECVVAIKELMTHTLAQNAEVTLLNLQGVRIASGKTSAEGILKLANVEQTPQALKINYQGVTSFYNLHNSSALSLTEFDVSSEVKDIDNRIFAYTERDIWRPGDSIYLDIMLNRSKFDFENGLPIIVRFINPKGVQHAKSIQSISDASIYSFTLGTGLEAPTGYWRAEIQIGPHEKVKSLRVETIRPNVVDLQFNFDNSEDEWIYSNRLSGQAAVDYLAGYPLKGGKVTVSADFRAIESPFSNFNNYRFLPYENSYTKQENEFLIFTTDDNGRASLNKNPDFQSMDGVFRMVMDCKIDLPGGGLNTMTRSYLVSPFDSYVGIQRARGRGWQGSFRYNETPGIRCVHLDKKGQKKNGKSSVKIYVYKYVKDWWYDRYRLTRGHNYHTSQRENLVLEETAEFIDGEYTFTHDQDKLGSGSFKIVLKDLASNHVTEYSYHNVSSRSYAAAINPQILQIRTDTNTYFTGQTMQVELPVLPNARALVSIESGDKVYDAFWTDLDKGSMKMKVHEHWTPNIYLSIHLVQNYGQSQNDRPMRMYAVKKIKINTTEGEVEPVIDAPEKSRPNAPLRITVSEKEDRPMEYTIAMVDQGLLNITGFETPDPRSHFNKLMALRVKTWDIFSELIRYMNPSFAGILSIGGDEALTKLLDESPDFNRFEPVAFHLGPFKLEAGASKEHTFDIPNYIGKVRVMVVASGEDRFGHAEENVRIASPLMIQSQLPRALNVSDKVIAPITLFRDEEEVRQVKIDLTSKNDKVSFASNSISATFDSGDQLTTKVPITVKEEAGTAVLNFQARSGSHESKEETKIFVNYPNSYSSESRFIEIEPGESTSVDLNCFGFRETQHLDLVVSATLLPDFVSYYESLIEYPHGCLEQLTSKGYALLYIDKIVQLSPVERKDVIDYLDAAILKIQSYQNNDGRFDYWPGGYYNVWGDLYAGLFLVEAQPHSRSVSEEGVRRWISHNKSKANGWRIEGTMTNQYGVTREENVQAYRLYALAKAGHAQKGAMNRFRSRSLSPLAKAYLAGAYGHAGLPDVGKEIMQSALNNTGESDSYYFWGSNLRNRAVIIAIGAELFPDLISRNYYRHWVEDINQRSWLSTQEKGHAFMACHSYLGEGSAIAKEIDFEIQSEKISERMKVSASESRRFAWQGEEVTGKAMVINHGQSRLYVRRIERAVSKELYEPAKSNNLSISVSYATPYGTFDQSQTVEQGDEITISVRVTNQTNVDLEYMALTVKSPSGWELLNPRIFKTAELNSDGFNYQDFRDDKVYTYFNLDNKGPGKSKVYFFKCRAQLLGNYYLPAVRAEDMYDLDVFAKTAAQRVTVE